MLYQRTIDWNRGTASKRETITGRISNAVQANDSGALTQTYTFIV